MKTHLGLTPEVFDRLPGTPVAWKRGHKAGSSAVVGLAVGMMIAGSGQGGASREAMVRAQLTRLVSNAPQVLVKVTGRQKGAGHALAHFQYIAGREHAKGRDEGIETDRGEIVKDPERMKEIAERWDANNLAVAERRVGATSISMVLAMPPGTDPDKLKDAAREFAQTEFKGHEWVMARHLDTQHPHVHLAIARVGEDRERLKPGPSELLHYRERFAELLRDRGIEADATRRADRGIVHKPDRAEIYWAKRRERETGDRSKGSTLAHAAAAKSVDRARAVSRGEAAPLSDKDSERLAEQQRKRDAYGKTAEALSTSPDQSDRQLGERVKTWLAGLAPAMTNDMRDLARGQAVEQERERIQRLRDDADIRRGREIVNERRERERDRDRGGPSR